MKKILSVLLAAVFVLGIIAFACSCNEIETNAQTNENTETVETKSPETETEKGNETEKEPDTETSSDKTDIEVITDNNFDETKIVFTFGAMSDTHIESMTGTVANKFTNALKQLKKRAEADCESGLGGTLFVGDLINSGYTSQSKYVEMSYFKNLYESVLDPKEVPMVYVLGNHDTVGEWTLNTVNEQKILNRYLSDVYFSTDVDIEALENYGCRHCIVGGYHILTIVPETKGPVNYSSEAKNWLDETLEKITKENPNQYVFVLTHPMIYDTVYGSLLGNHWYTEDLTSILEKYPQVVTFSGHLHFPLNDPRSIMQTSFTSLGCGSVRYMAIESGGYMDMAGATTMKDKDLFSQGLLVEVDENGNMRIVRMDFYHEEEIGESWEISHPDANNTHLTKYTKARGNEENNTAPVLSELKYTTKKASNGNLNITVEFAKGEDDEFVHDYALNIYKDGTLRRSFKILADFYLHSQTKDMKKTWTVDCGSFTAGHYDIELIAYDSWEKASEPLKVSFELTKDVPEEEQTNTELSVYADFDFENGKVIEKMGNVNVKMNGATVGKSKVKLSGKEYEVEALKTSNGKYVVCTFNKLSTQEDVKKFAESGFSVEAFYYAENSGSVQGIVCGTQTGGWGLAVTADYKPYFITSYGTQGKYNPSVTSTETASKTDLVHVVAVYDFANKSSSIYVNGKLKDVKTIGDSFCVGQGLTFNVFCLGADVTTDCLGGDFNTKNMTMLDAKIYTGVLEQSDVNDAYASALDMLK